MKIKEYLFYNDMTVKKLAEISDINAQTMSLLKMGAQKPSFKTATKIVNSTKGQVGYEELLPEVYYAMVNEYKKKM